MARTVWKGSLSFGLVNVPVGLYPATEDRTIHFHQFQEGTADRIRLRKVNERTGDEVPAGQIVKGYDLGNGESVIVEPDELEAIAPERSRNLEISDFVDIATIDPIYFRSTYYLAPADDGALKAYRLLARAMETSGKAAIAPLVMRGKEYLCVVRARDGVLVLETLYFDDEIRSPDEMLGEVKGVDDPKALRSPRPPNRELDMAVQLVSSMTAEWDPTNYRDSYRHEVEQLIEAKRQGKAVVANAPEESPAPVVDLMTALEASVRKVGSSTSGRGPSHASGGKAASRPASTRGKSSRRRSSAAKAS